MEKEEGENLAGGPMGTATFVDWFATPAATKGLGVLVCCGYSDTTKQDLLRRSPRF